MCIRDSLPSVRLKPTWSSTYLRFIYRNRLLDPDLRDLGPPVTTGENHTPRGSPESNPIQVDDQFYSALRIDRKAPPMAKEPISSATETGAHDRRNKAEGTTSRAQQTALSSKSSYPSAVVVEAASVAPGRLVTRSLMRAALPESCLLYTSRCV